MKMAVVRSKGAASSKEGLFLDPYVAVVTIVRAGSTEAYFKMTSKEFRPVIFLHVLVLFPEGITQHQLLSHPWAALLNLTVPPWEGTKLLVRSFCSTRILPRGFSQQLSGLPQKGQSKVLRRK